MEIVGKRLRFLREGVKITQKKLASMIGISQVSINRYEAGAGEAPFKTLLWYADHFDVSLDYIFGRTKNPQGKLYEYKPRIIDDSKELKRFIEMCFDPNSPMNDRLKQTLIGMLEEVQP